MPSEQWALFRPSGVPVIGPTLLAHMWRQWAPEPPSGQTPRPCINIWTLTVYVCAFAPWGSFVGSSIRSYLCTRTFYHSRVQAHVASLCQRDIILTCPSVKTTAPGSAKINWSQWARPVSTGLSTPLQPRPSQRGCRIWVVWPRFLSGGSFVESVYPLLLDCFDSHCCIFVALNA